MPHFGTWTDKNRSKWPLSVKVGYEALWNSGIFYHFVNFWNLTRTSNFSSTNPTYLNHFGRNMMLKLLNMSFLKIKISKISWKNLTKSVRPQKWPRPMWWWTGNASREFLILKILKCEMAKINWPLSIYKNILRIWFSVFRLLPFCVTWWFLTSQTKPVYK